jgi:hypothetical protein
MDEAPGAILASLSCLKRRTVRHTGRSVKSWDFVCTAAKRA